SRKWCVTPVAPSCASNDLTNVPAFSVKLRARSDNPIGPGNIIRIFLHPLLTWNIQSNPQAACTPFEGSVCGSGGIISAAAESVSGGAVVGEGGQDHVNVVKLTIPAIFDSITDVIQHTIHLGNLRLPESGFFPETITAELLRQEGAGPHYWSSVATGSSKVWIKPTVSSVSIVARAGDGNAKPFKGDTKNELYFRIVTGFNVYAATRGDVELTFVLPPGYKCAQTGSSCAGSCISDNYCPEDLSIFKDPQTGEYLVPSYRGQVGQEEADIVNEAEWSTTEAAGVIDQPNYVPASCRLTFQRDMILYGSSVVYMGITVDNPAAALQQSDPSNVWKFEAHQKGSSPTYDEKAKLFTLTQPSTASAFAPVETPTDFSANVAVLGKMSEEVIIPTNFAAGEWNELEIFFKTEQECGTAADGAAQVWVDAPAGFDFTKYCALLPLDNDYFVPEPVIPTQRLPVGTNIECLGAATLGGSSGSAVYNRAKITTISRILGGQFYAFSLQVHNAATYVHNAKWTITTYTKSNSPCDRSFYNVRMNPHDPADGSSLPWAIYQQGMPGTHFGVRLADLRPAVLETDVATDITVFPIIVQKDTKENFRITAPGGYKWEFTSQQFKYKTAQVGLANSEVVEGTDADLPLTTIPSRPIVEPFNELIVAYLSSNLVAGRQYGIKTKIRVPRNTPTASSNTFIIEFGFDKTTLSGRSEAGVTNSPPVQALINGEVTYHTSVAGATDNELCFRIQTISPIVRGGGIVIQGPSGFIFQENCVTLASPGFMSLPTDSYCRYQIDETAQDVPVVTITAGVSGIGANMYKFCLAVENPTTASDTAGFWTFHSYEIISEESYLDYSTQVPGFTIKRPMFAYHLVEQRRREVCGVGSVSTNCSLEDFSYWLTGRNDRPDVANQLIFSFALTEDSVDGELVVIAPTGFEFDYECEVVTDSSRVFDATKSADDSTLPAGYTQSYEPWPDPPFGEITRCTGEGNVARVEINEGLTAEKNYVFRLTVLKNPTGTPQWNKWLLEFGDEASEPIGGFPVWAFYYGKITASDTSTSSGDLPTRNLVTINIGITNRVPAGGRINVREMILAPAGFLIDSECDATVTVRDTGIPIDTKCQGASRPSNECQLLILSDQELSGGTIYQILLMVTNPSSVSPAKSWTFQSYESDAVTSTLDYAQFTGFGVNLLATTFSMLSASSRNGLTEVQFEFLVSLPDRVVAGDEIVLLAPLGFELNKIGKQTCTDYALVPHITVPPVALDRSPPVCSANRMSWTVQDGTFPASTYVRFTVSSINPASTPEDNTFQIKHLRSSGREVHASAVMKGYNIVPQLKDVKVSLVEPFVRATSGYCTVMIELTPVTVANLVVIKGHITDRTDAYFGMTSVTLRMPPPDIQRDDAISKRSLWEVTISSSLKSEVDFLYVLENVQNPTEIGVSLWDITTYLDTTEIEQRKDAKLDAEGFEVLGSIRVYSDSRVDPRVYGAKDSVIYFALKNSHLIPAGSILELHAPPGYVVKNESFVRLSGIVELDGQHGLDPAPTGSSAFVYRIPLAADITEDNEFAFTITTDLPEVQLSQTSWLVQAIFEDKVVATNDFGFPGFALVGTLPFSVVPGLQTPGAEITLRISFSLAAALRGQTYVSLEITAPLGFKFSSGSSCLKSSSTEGSGSVFGGCVGNNNLATLSTTRNTLEQGQTVVEMVCVNPDVTPSNNFWRLALFLDSDGSLYRNIQTEEGYEIKAMEAYYRGNNRLGVSAPGFFTFMPAKEILGPIQVDISLLDIYFTY
ncbi:protein arginine methyltransferase 10, partial [Perkinsus chesapeaki]